MFFDWLRSHRPDLVPRYERLYAGRSRVPERERRAIERAAGLHRTRLPSERGHRVQRGGERRDPPPAPPEPARQEALF